MYIIFSLLFIERHHSTFTSKVRNVITEATPNLRYCMCPTVYVSLVPSVSIDLICHDSVSRSMVSIKPDWTQSVRQYLLNKHEVQLTMCREAKVCR